MKNRTLDCEIPDIVNRYVYSLSCSFKTFWIFALTLQLSQGSGVSNSLYFCTNKNFNDKIFFFLRKFNALNFYSILVLIPP